MRACKHIRRAQVFTHMRACSTDSTPSSTAGHRPLLPLTSRPPSIPRSTKVKHLKSTNKCHALYDTWSGEPLHARVWQKCVFPLRQEHTKFARANLFPIYSSMHENLSYCNSFIVSISRSIVDDDGSINSRILTCGHIIWTQTTRKLIVPHGTTFILLSRGLGKFMSASGNICHWYLFICNVQWNGNCFPLAVYPN